MREWEKREEKKCFGEPQSTKTTKNFMHDSLLRLTLTHCFIMCNSSYCHEFTALERLTSLSFHLLSRSNAAL